MSMCPHCGRLFVREELKDGLIPYHDDLPPLRSCCPGSKQGPRNPETDHRELWNGEPNPHLKKKA